MKVLVACEESQRVCISFREQGHEAYSCDIQDQSGGHPEWHIMQSVIPLLNGNCEFETTDGIKHKITGKWDLIIAHPPCTYLSNAGACRLYPHKGQLNEERYKKGLQGKDFFMKLYNADCEHICVETRYHQKSLICRNTHKLYSHMSTDTHTVKKPVCGLRDCQN